jgi:2,4-dienoyl-CoA reductase-like NADH-dependent reductase (Old Yellow Enzyme family)
MLIELTSEYRIDASDGMNWAVQRKAGKTWKSIAYHANLAYALEDVLRKRLMAEPLAGDVKQMLDVVKRTCADLVQIGREIQKQMQAQGTRAAPGVLTRSGMQSDSRPCSTLL